MAPLSILIPVKDGAAYLRKTLPALAVGLEPGDEVLVSDDGSRDDAAAVAAAHGARFLPHAENTGPAGARNRAARVARSALLVFLDADVRVHAETLHRLRHALDDASLVAAFGSYDARPEAGAWVSVYKNLAHHFVHQRSGGEASTFWAGCGVIRADVFRDLGGFDEGYRRPSIEDVELGYRLRAAGHRIRLLPEIQVTHLKEWSLGSWLRADLVDRAIPWARLLAEGRGLPRDLNFTRRDRLASGLVALGLGALAASLLWPAAAIAAGGAWLVAVALDAPFLLFCARHESVAFALAAAAFQLLHRAAGLVGLAIGLVTPRARVATAGPST